MKRSNKINDNMLENIVGGVELFENEEQSLETANKVLTSGTQLVDSVTDLSIACVVSTKNRIKGTFEFFRYIMEYADYS